MKKIPQQIERINIIHLIMGEQISAHKHLKTLKIVRELAPIGGNADELF